MSPSCGVWTGRIERASPSWAITASRWAEALSSRALVATTEMVVLARGRLIAEGKPDVIRDHPKVQEVYFGSGKTFEKTQEPST